MSEPGNIQDEGYIRTSTHNYVSRKASVSKPERVELKGKSVLKPGVRIMGDLAVIRMGRYCMIEEGCTLSPAPLGTKHVPMIFRGNIVVGKNCKIKASAIGTNVYIGSNVHIGQRCIIKDCCWIESGTVLGNDTVIPPFSRVEGKPGKVIDELPPSAALELQELAQTTYLEFLSTDPST